MKIDENIKEQYDLSLTLTREESIGYLKNNQIESSDGKFNPDLMYLGIGFFLIIILIYAYVKFKSKRTVLKQDIKLKVDIHAHLIPGIDDGAKTMDDSIALIVKLKSLGYQKLIITPHIMGHRYKNNANNIKEAFDRLQLEVNQRAIDIKLEVAAEYYLDEDFMTLLNNKDLLIFGDNYLLFETSYTVQPINLFEAINQINFKGYKAVLAHPERYIYMQRDIKIYEMLKKSTKVLFQVNLNSLEGYYGKEAQKIAQHLIRNGWVDFLGSDTHHMKQLDILQKVKKSSYLKDMFNNNYILNNTL